MRFLHSVAALVATAAFAPLSAQTSPAAPPAAPAAPASVAKDSIYSLDEFKSDDCSRGCPPRILNPEEFRRAITRQYPPFLRDAGVGGVVEVAVVVDTTGAVEPGSARVISTDHESFSLAALRVIHELRFSPARLQNRPVRVRVGVPLTFSVTSMPPMKAGGSPRP